MFINFISDAIQNGQKNNINFKSPVKKSKMGEYDVWEFTEPSQNIQNRIEVSNENINIFIGVNTINLNLNQDMEIEYLTTNGKLLFIAKTEFIKHSNENVEFKYSLHQGDVELGNYHIKLLYLNDV